MANDNAKNGNRLCTKTEVDVISTGQTDMKFKVFLNGNTFSTFSLRSSAFFAACNTSLGSYLEHYLTGKVLYTQLR